MDVYIINQTKFQFLSEGIWGKLRKEAYPHLQLNFQSGIKIYPRSQPDPRFFYKVCPDSFLEGVKPSRVPVFAGKIVIPKAPSKKVCAFNVTILEDKHLHFLAEEVVGIYLNNHLNSYLYLKT